MGLLSGFSFDLYSGKFENIDRNKAKNKNEQQQQKSSFQDQEEKPKTEETNIRQNRNLQPRRQRFTGTQNSAVKPNEPYNRKKHYGNTPTNADRREIGGESVDHDPPLVQRYYEGDPAIGEKPGYLQTPDERKASANDRTRMKPSTKTEQRKQGAEMTKYSKRKKKEHEL